MLRDIGLCIFEQAMRIANLWIDSRRPAEEDTTIYVVCQKETGLSAEVCIVDPESEAEAWRQAAEVVRTFMESA